jgi:hypothetical protein
MNLKAKEKNLIKEAIMAGPTVRHPREMISGLQRGTAELETNKKKSCRCLRFFRLSLLLMFDSFSH